MRLDPLGGIAGDMFVAAMLDALPDAQDAVSDAFRRLGPPPSFRWRLEDGVSGGFRGRRLRIIVPDDGHTHRSWAAIDGQLADASLPPAVRDRARAIYRLLAEAEGAVHGTSPDDVTLHELGAWDSLMDVVAAATVIEATGADVPWFVSPIPLGHGRVMTAHGPVPVPAPATAFLLSGLRIVDDGVAGERVTPTGAAILRHLACAEGPLPPGRLVGSGTGLGSRDLDGIANILRVSLMELEDQPVFVKVVVQGPCACDRFWRSSSELGQGAIGSDPVKDPPRFASARRAAHGGLRPSWTGPSPDGLVMGRSGRRDGRLFGRTVG